MAEIVVCADKVHDVRGRVHLVSNKDIAERLTNRGTGEPASSHAAASPSVLPLYAVCADQQEHVVLNVSHQLAFPSVRTNAWSKHRRVSMDGVWIDAMIIMPSVLANRLIEATTSRADEESRPYKSALSSPDPSRW